jgi:HAL2 family 3'(2'),5'-bisphosphate nucleotidase
MSTGRSFLRGQRLYYELESAIDIVSRASRMAREIQKRYCDATQNLGEATTIAKDDASPVTIADLAVQALILGELHSIFPQDRFVAEETSSSVRDGRMEEAIRSWLAKYSTRGVDTRVRESIDLGADSGGNQGRVWVLDPVDGTKGFLRNQQFCIALALLVDGLAELGVLGCPNLSAIHEAERVTSSYTEGGEGEKCLTIVNGSDGCVFFAASGTGAFMQSLADTETPSKPQQIHVNANTDPSWAVMAESVERGHSSHSLTGRMIRILGIRQRLGVDSQCKYGLLSRGEACVFLRFPRPGYVENIWDHAAGAVVLKEAGGKVTDAMGSELDFSRGRKLSNARGIVATNGHMHPAVLAAVKHVLAEDAA